MILMSKNQNGWKILGSAGLAAVGLLAPLARGAEITGLDFKMSGGSSNLTIQADGPFTIDKQENSQDKQIVLDIKGVTLGKRVSRKLDTSSFDSKVSLISPYSVKEDGGGSRIVMQLRDMASANVTQTGNQ